MTFHIDISRWKVRSKTSRKQVCSSDLLATNNVGLLQCKQITLRHRQPHGEVARPRNCWTRSGLAWLTVDCISSVHRSSFLPPLRWCMHTSGSSASKPNAMEKIYCVARKRLSVAVSHWSRFPMWTSVLDSNCYTTFSLKAALCTALRPSRLVITKEWTIMKGHRKFEF